MRKYAAGHGTILMRARDDAAAMQRYLVPGVTRAMMKRYSWRTLEPTQGVYVLSELALDLQWAQAHGVLLIAMIEDKSFTDEHPLPDYMVPFAERNKFGGWTALRWTSFVIRRWKALTRHIGVAFDRHSAFGGISTQETALSLDDAPLDAGGYTPERYRDAYIDMLRHCATVMPTSRVYWHVNFIARDIKNTMIDQVLAGVGDNVVLGGPDVLMHNAALLARAYPLYERHKNRCPLFAQISPDSYRQEHIDGSQCSEAEMFDFARSRLHVNLLLWTGVLDFDKAVPVMCATPTFNVEKW